MPDVSWRGLCQTICSHSAGVVSGLWLPETILLNPETGKPQALLRSGPDGKVVPSQNSRELEMPRIYEKISRHCAQQILSVGANEVTEEEQKAAVLFTEDGQMQVISRAILKRLVQQGSFGPGILCLQAYMYPKRGEYGSSETVYQTGALPSFPSPLHLRCELTYSKENERRFKHSVALSSGAAGIGRGMKSGEVPSRNRATNDRMVSITLGLVHLVEHSQPGNKVTHMVTEYTVDHNDSVWLLHCTVCTLSPQEEFQASSSLSFDGGISDSHTKTSHTRRRRRTQNTGSGLNGDAVHSQSLSALPQTLLDGAAPANLSASISSSLRGTTQQRATRGVESNRLRGGATTVCPGDFCSYNARFIAEEDPMNGIQNGHLYFRQNPSMGLNTHPSISQGADSFAQSSTLPSELSSNVSLGQGEGNIVSKRIINLARKERKLVDAMLTRHRLGEPPDYLNGEENAKFIEEIERNPSAVYDSVRVCSTCSLVYNLVDSSRTQALKELELKRKRQGRRVRKVSDHLNPEDDTSEASSITALDPFKSIMSSGLRDVSTVGEGSEKLLQGSLISSAGGADEQQSIMQAERAIASLNKNDLAELRSFMRPPPAVEMVAGALMTMLTGGPLPWEQTRRTIANGDRFLRTLREYSLNDLVPARRRKLQAYIENPMFQPAQIAPISRAAAKFCAWILGMEQAAQWRSGQGHQRINPLTGATLFPPIRTPETKSRSFDPSNSLKPMESLTFAEKLAMKKKQRQGLFEESTVEEPWSLAQKSIETYDTSTLLDPAEDTTYSSIFTNKVTKMSRNEAALVQQRQMEKLAQPFESDTQLPGGGRAGEKTFHCDNGAEIPYRVVGRIPREASRVNFVVINDIFDTMDTAEILLKQTLKDHPTAQALLFNYPGQFGSTGPIMNNEQIADCIGQLMAHIDKEALMFLSSSPFHILSFGNGASIALALVLRHGNDYQRSLRSLISVNGFAAVDSQLAAIMHSSLRFFDSFPTNRPDLPVSYFTKFIFSEGYLRRVPLNLALSLYTAVANHITLAGRIQLCKGVLQHKDLSKEVKKVRIPLIIVQSTENVLVNPANVDPFLEGRSASYLYNHQIDMNAPVGKNCLGKEGVSLLLQSLSKNNGAFLVWVKSGHEVRQEARRVITDLLDTLCCPTPEHNRVTLPPGAPIMSILPSNDFIAHIDGKRKPKHQEQQVVPEDKVTELSPSISDFAEDKSSVNSFTSEKHTPAFKGAKPSIPPRIDGGSVSLLSQDISQEDEQAQVPRARRQRRRRPGAKSVELPGVEESEQAERADAADSASYKSSEISFQAALQPTRIRARRVPEEDSDLSFLQGYSAEDSIISSTMGPLPSVTGHSLTGFEASKEMKDKMAWADTVPSAAEVLAEVSLIERKTRAALAEIQLKLALEGGLTESTKSEDAATRLAQIEREQELRRKRMAEEELRIMQQTELNMARWRIEQSSMQRRAEIDDIEAELVTKGIIPAYLAPPGMRFPIRTMRPKDYLAPPDLPAHMREPVSEIDKLFADLDQMEKDSRKAGFMKLQDYQKVKQQMEEAKFEEEARLKSSMASDLRKLKEAMTLKIQKVMRGALGRKKARIKRELKNMSATKKAAALKLTALGRGYLGRKRFRKLKEAWLLEVLLGGAAVTIQRTARGHFARRLAYSMRRERAIRLIQRVFRGHMGRKIAREIRARLEALRRRNLAAIKIQSAWRMHLQWQKYETLRVQSLAATELQRLYRGHLARKKVKRRRQWDAAAPGPERMRLGIRLLEESKSAFDHQQAEIDALHRAQEKAEIRISYIHDELKDAELELSVLEREMTEIDHIEQDLAQLTHERDLLQRGIIDKAVGLGMAASMDPKAKKKDSSEITQREMNARQRALDIQLQVKKAERDKRRQELEAEFASVFGEVSRKKMELKRLEAALADLEATRARKEREFARIQQNLMDLLQEQKFELDTLREKGVELELAASSTAAAAAATAAKAKESQAKSKAMFSQTEELMKFQFMAMSLSYFSGLNMLNQLQDMNADTTLAAVAGAAEAASAAAAVSAAANLPDLSNMPLEVGNVDLVKRAAAQKKAQLDDQKRFERDAKIAMDANFPEDAVLWTPDDVGRWLDTLNLTQYKKAFMEGSVDGKFLMDLREEDISQLLGVTHPLHVRKILVNRQRIMPLSKEDVSKKNTMKADAKANEEAETLDPDVVFSQVRNNRLKRVEASLTAGFPVNSTDERGNTLLMIAAQNLNRRMCELLLARGALINHQNSSGNTALHFAMTYDTEGTLGEFLIMHGADDSIENNQGLSPYDGVG